MSKKATVLTAVLAAPLLLSMPSVASAAWGLSGVQGLTGSGPTLVRIPSNNPVGGITHELNPSEFYAFRVKVYHSQSLNVFGWASDNFTPTANNIQICDVTGCEAPSIETSDEDLDWTDTSKITVVLQAKRTLLGVWETYQLN